MQKLYTNGSLVLKCDKINYYVVSNLVQNQLTNREALLWIGITSYTIRYLYKCAK